MHICNSDFSYFAARSKVRDKLLRSIASSAFEFQAFRNSPGALAGSDVVRVIFALADTPDCGYTEVVQTWYCRGTLLTDQLPVSPPPGLHRFDPAYLG